MRNDKFELVRYGLKRYNLIEDGPTMDDRQCEVEWDKGQCYSCMATHICTKRVKRCFHTSRFVVFISPENVVQYRILSH